jgi:processive 1,2-diacylglycerol beta-glucosyltransferase
VYPNIDAYAVATPEMQAMLESRGVATDRVLLSGIPVDRRFATPRAARDVLRAELGLPRDKRIVLIMGGGVGIGPLENMMHALGSVDLPIAAAVVVGRNRALEGRVTAAAERTAYPLRVFGFVDNVFDFMHASDVLLTKSGGLTASEALAARVPMVLVRPLPGPEERNTSYLVAHRAAVHARGDAQVAEAVRDVLGSAEHRAALLANVDALRRPLAAERVAERICALLDAR